MQVTCNFKDTGETVIVSLTDDETVLSLKRKLIGEVFPKEMPATRLFALRIRGGEGGACIGDDEELICNTQLSTEMELELTQESVAVQAPMVYDTNGTVTAFTLSRSGKFLFCCEHDTASLWDTLTAQIVWHFERRGLTAPAFSPSENIVAVARGVTVLALSEGAVLYEFVGHKNTVRTVCFTRSGSNLLSAGDDKTIRVWCMLTGHTIGVRQAVRINKMVVSERHIFSTNTQSVIKMWDIEDGGSGACIKHLKGHKGDITGLVVLECGQVLLSSGVDGTVRLWDCDAMDCVSVIRYASAVFAIAVAPVPGHVFAILKKEIVVNDFSKCSARPLALEDERRRCPTVTDGMSVAVTRCGRFLFELGSSMASVREIVLAGGLKPIPEEKPRVRKPRVK